MTAPIPLAPSLAEWVEDAVFAVCDIYAARNELVDREAVTRAFLGALWSEAVTHG